MPLHCIEIQQITIIILEVIVGHDEGKLLFSVDFLSILAQSNAILQLLLVQGVGSTQIPFLMCTLEIPQKFAAQVLTLNLLLFLLLSFLLKLSFSQTMSFSGIFVFASSFIHVDLSIVQTQHP